MIMSLLSLLHIWVTEKFMGGVQERVPFLFPFLFVKHEWHLSNAYQIDHRLAAQERGILDFWRFR
jgi:hypothetical protein